MIEDILEQLIELAELYLDLDSRIQTGSVYKIRTDVITPDPTADLVILRDDILEEIKNTSHKLHSL